MIPLLVAFSVFYPLLGIGLLEVLETTERRVGGEPPDPLGTIALWPLILVMCAITRLAGI